MRLFAAVVLLTVGTAAQSAPGAKAMFYKTGALPLVEVGIRYWFESESGVAIDPQRITAAAGNYTLRIRGNTSGYVSIWDMDRGIELMSRADISVGTGLPGSRDLEVPDVFEIAADAPERRLIIVWGRSQTEQAGRAAGAEARLRDLTSRVGRDGAPQIVRESDDATPGRIGTYVINREGMPLATELVFRAR